MGASNEEPLTPDTQVAAAKPKPEWVERHPMFHKPADMYENTKSGPVGKTATAVVIGVPMGVVGEVKQAIVGQPPSGY